MIFLLHMFLQEITNDAEKEHSLLSMLKNRSAWKSEKLKDLPCNVKNTFNYMKVSCYQNLYTYNSFTKMHH